MQIPGDRKGRAMNRQGSHRKGLQGVYNSTHRKCHPSNQEQVILQLHINCKPQMGPSMGHGQRQTNFTSHWQPIDEKKI
eukprot:1142888-Pelagomonas_calceolata.AAC.1